MALKIVDLDDVELSFTGDTEEPKTVFVVKPFDEFEYMKMAGIYYQCLEDVENQTDDDFMIKLFATEKGEPLKKMLSSFFNDKVKEVRNIKNKKGDLVTLTREQLNINMFSAISLMDIFSQVMGNALPDEEEIKN